MFRFLDLKPGVVGVLVFLLRFVRCVGVWLLLVDGLLPVSVGGGVDAALAASTILGVSIVSPVTRSTDSCPSLPSPLIACEGAQHEHDE